jgi:hypothetical protein
VPYTVTSDNFAYPRGTVLLDEQLAGTSIPALIEGGHLSAQPESDTPSTPAEPATEEQ